jgi:hypothetical protein
VQRSGDAVDDLPLVETREEIPERQDPSPSIDAFNESFGTSFRGELLSVSREMAIVGGGASKLLLLWNSPEFVDETGGEASTKKKSRLTGDPSSAAIKHASVVEKHVSSSAQKSLMISRPTHEITLVKMNLAGSCVFPCICILRTSLCFFEVLLLRRCIFRSF